MSPLLNRFALTTSGKILKIVDIDDDERILTLESYNPHRYDLYSVFDVKVLSKEDEYVFQVLES